MFKALVEALKNKELRKRLYFTLFAFVVFKVMTYIPVPFADPAVVPKLAENLSGNLGGIANAFTGGALRRFSIIALGVTPYITMSIVIQLLQMDIVPKLAEWSKEGESGKHKIKQVTRYTSLLLAFVQALAMSIGFDKLYKGTLLILPNNQPITAFHYVYIALVMTGGTAAILWVADQITSKGIGNGTSMIIMAGIISTFPSMINQLFVTYVRGMNATTHKVNGKLKDWIAVTDPKQGLIFVAVLLVMILIIVGVIFMQNATRKIPIQYANRANSATLSGKKDSSLPIKLNPSGVIPVIFASSLLSLPLTVAGFMPQGSSTRDTLTMIFSYSKPIGFVLYVLLIFLFSFFYAFVQISPEKVADNLRKQGSYVPGVRPGIETENFISGVLFRTTVVGATYLMIIAIIPIIFSNLLGIGVVNNSLSGQLKIGGTSLLIVVGVAQQMFKQLETKAKSQKYSGFIK